jgi:hypothetical protein
MPSPCARYAVRRYNAMPPLLAVKISSAPGGGDNASFLSFLNRISTGTTEWLIRASPELTLDERNGLLEAEQRCVAFVLFERNAGPQPDTVAVEFCAEQFDGRVEWPRVRVLICVKDRERRSSTVGSFGNTSWRGYSGMRSRSKFWSRVAKTYSLAPQNTHSCKSLGRYTHGIGTPLPTMA